MLKGFDNLKSMIGTGFKQYYLAPDISMSEVESKHQVQNCVQFY